ncbi:hypothetical protein A9Z42_0033700 [Trichoderma parareesei]|uniref:Uncharacterized protein n=1 Tax=Trichoderma parareesei TaxID=858221 RepID=A0A2H2Z5Y0_TRIPA|nr:hypothetical protein A9Z42_0033700 [Trichoderma parareesei]
MASPAHRPQLPKPSRPKRVSAAALARIEKQRRDIVKRLGPCPSGCSDLDGYVLLGGLERGSVVGISAEEEDVAGLTISICSLLSKAVHKVQIVTPKPPSTILVLLKNAIAAELKARGVTAAEDVAAQRRDCLDSIMLSRVFDMDGFCEVLADLEDGLAERGVDDENVRAIEESTGDNAQDNKGDGGGGGVASAAAAAAATSVERGPGQQPPVVAEIQDSQDEDESLSPLPTPPQPAVQDEMQQKHTVDQADAIKPTTGTAGINNNSNNNSNNNTAATDIPDPRATTTTTTTPDIILVTHFSSLLTSFFTQRDKPTAHATLRHLSSRLRRLSRTLPSHPLVLIINSTDSGAAAHSSASASHGYEIPPAPPPPSEQPPEYHNNNKSPPVVAPTLRSIFNPATASGQGFFKLNKPTFGLVFTQLLDLHLLCTRAPRPPSKETTPSSRALTVVEVLLDDIGLWQGERGRRRRREQRWTVVASSSGRIVDAVDGERLRTSGGRTRWN